MKDSRFCVHTLLMVCLIMALGVASGCGDDDNEGHVIDNTGASCAVPADCFPDVEHDDLQGEVECIDRVEDGYCTHTCTTDEDCCAIPGECEWDFPQVCAPFESMEGMRCFLSCEDTDPTGIDPDHEGGELDGNEFCSRYAHAAFGCRSSGGGSENRKICVP